MNLHELEDQPTFEPIHTLIDERREGRKVVAKRHRKSLCYKQAYSRKQALTKSSMLVSEGTAKFLRTYKCQKCDYWHLTSQPPRHGK